VMDNIIEFTRKRGFEQTPVFCGEQAGSLVLAVAGDTKRQLSDSLEKILSVSLAEYEPDADDTAILLKTLGDTIRRTRLSTPFVAKSQDDKLIRIEQLTQTILSWFQHRAEGAQPGLPDGYQFSVTHVPIEEVPLSDCLASTLHESKYKSAIELQFKYTYETRYRREPKHRYSAVIPDIFGSSNYENVAYQHQIVNGVSQPDNYPDCSVVLSFRSLGHSVPHCALSFSVIPSTFGAFLQHHFAASALSAQMQEVWTTSSFSTSDPEAVPMGDDAEEWVIGEASQLFAQFLSFIAEHIEARDKWFASLGAIRKCEVPDQKALPGSRA